MAISEKAVNFMKGNLERGKAIPGQSLTNDPQQPYNWEKPAEFTNPRETMLYIFKTLLEPDTTTNILLSLQKGVSVIDIASITLYSGFLEGKWNPDLMTLLMEPTMYMLIALAEKAEIEYVMDAEDKNEIEDALPEQQIEMLNSGSNELDKMKKAAAERVNPQSVPEEIRQVIEKTEIPTSLLEKVNSQSTSLLSKGK
jgi:hypothetical protein|tara:strand:+ start:516 stop:1109 length:594 start_codon:yes stop_codon:yes gene_type:complete